MDAKSLDMIDRTNTSADKNIAASRHCNFLQFKLTYTQDGDFKEKIIRKAKASIKSLSPIPT